MPRSSLLLAVFVGGCVGGLTRYLLVGGLGATLAVNVAGAFLLALLLSGLTLAPAARALLGSGFCGALTTFSGIVVPAVDRPALGYAVTSVLAGLAAAFAGVVLGRLVRRDR